MRKEKTEFEKGKRHGYLLKEFIPTGAAIYKSEGQALRAYKDKLSAAEEEDYWYDYYRGVIHALTGGKSETN